MMRAFFDVLTSKLNSEPPDYEWVVRLYSEIRTRLANLTPTRQDLRAELEEAMDVELFDQMLRNNAYSAENLHTLVKFVFTRMASLEAPARNVSTSAMLGELQAELQRPGCTFASFVPHFLRSTHVKLDEIETDIANFHQDMRQRSNPNSRQGSQPASRSQSPGPRHLE
jgi:hypothetical protein